MLLFKWSTVLRNWFLQVAQDRTASRNSARCRRRSSFSSISVESLEERLVLSAIVVTSTGDAVAVDGVVTLREAILSINNGSDINGDIAASTPYGSNDTISFAIPGAGVQTISPATPLPTIAKPVAILGYTQSGASANTLLAGDDANLLVQLSGTTAGAGANGLVLGAGSNGSSISGFVVNGFSNTGILVQSDGNTITGNFVGTDVAGNAVASVSGAFGIEIADTLGNTIGGITPAARNVIGGNSDGVHLGAGAQVTVIQGNFIGLGADGTTAVGNRLHGIALQGSSGQGVQDNQIGGTLAGAGNTIANSGSAGVAIYGDALSSTQNSGNAILGNSIFNNGLSNPAILPGIDLVGGFTYPLDDGVTLNDLGDVDIGPNMLQNFPVLTSVSTGLLGTTILGSLNSAANTTYRIEFFSNPAVVGSSFGQGQTFLGFTNVTTDASGLATINATLGTAVPNGQFITATATSSGGVSGGLPLSGPSFLGTAANFAVLAGSTVTITGPTVLLGDVGVSPGSVVSGTFATTGTVHAADGVASLAQTDLVAGYNHFANLVPTINLTGVDLGGLTLTPGIYHFDTSAQLTGPLPLTLDTQGDPHAQFVFQIGSTLTTAAGVGSSVVVLGGPDDSIFWQVGSSATIGVGTAFAGNILALTSITLETGATLASGRALARNGAVTLDSIRVDSTTASQNNTSEFSAAVQLGIPTISISDVTVAEGNLGVTNATFTVTLSAASGQPVTVIATSADGTASALSDYLALVPTTLTFAPGVTTLTVTVSVNGDTMVEPDENFVVNLSAPTNATLLDAQGAGTITNDDGAGSTLIISSPTIIEGNAGTSVLTFTVTSPNAVAGGFTVAFNVADITTDAADYTLITPGPLTFLGNAGEAQTIMLAVHGDTIVEGAETLAVTLGTVTASDPLTAASIVTGEVGTGTITNDDTSTLTISSPVVVEGNAGTSAMTFTVTSPAAVAGGFTVDFIVANITTNGADYSTVTSSPLTFSGTAGETQTITINVIGDTLAESDETLSVTLGTVIPLAPVAAASIVSGAVGVGTIVDDDSPLTITSATSASIAENTPTSQVVLDVNTTSTPGHVVQFALSGPDAARFSIDPATGEIRFSNIPDFEVPVDQGADNVYNVTVTATADFIPVQSVTQDLVLTVLPNNDNAPIFTSVATTAVVPSGTLTSTVILDIDATDADLPAQTLTYSLSGPDAALFAINGSTGQISFIASPDVTNPLDQGADNIYNMTVTVTDNGAPTLSSSQNLVVTVGPLNTSASPIITSVATVSIAENTPISSVVLDVDATDASIPVQTLTYTLSGPDAAVFAINSATGVITWLASPDYEIPTDQGLDNVYHVTATVTDNGAPALSTSQNLTITVTPLNDNVPVFSDASPTFSIPENLTVGAVVGNVAATDADLPPQTLTYSIVGGNAAGAFTIDPSTGQITVSDSTPLNFAVTPQFTLNVRVSDSGSPTPLTADATVVVNVTHVEVGPTITIPVPVGLFHLGRIPAFVSPVATFTYDSVSTPNYAGAQLTASIVANRSQRDRLSIFPKGSAADQINVRGHNVYYAGLQIGTVAGGSGAKQPNLIVKLNSHATTNAIDSLVRRINFFVKDHVGVTRTVHVQLTNIGGVDSNIATRDIQVTDQQDATL
jgi:hypothetical protein